MSLKNCSTISSSYAFQVYGQYSPRRWHFSLTAWQRFYMLPWMMLALPGAPRLIVRDLRFVVGAPRLVASLSRYSQACRLGSQTWCRCSQVLPGAPKHLSDVLRCFQTYHNHSHGTPGPAMRDPSYSNSWLECPPRVWYSPEIDASKFALHMFSDTPEESEWLNYILLMWSHCIPRIKH